MFAPFTTGTFGTTGVALRLSKRPARLAGVELAPSISLLWTSDFRAASGRLCDRVRGWVAYIRCTLFFFERTLTSPWLPDIVTRAVTLYPTERETTLVPPRTPMLGK